MPARLSCEKLTLLCTITSNYYSYYYHYFIYLSSTILHYANHVTLSVRHHLSIELWRMRLISVSKYINK